MARSGQKKNVNTAQYSVKNQPIGVYLFHHQLNSVQTERHGLITLALKRGYGRIEN